MKSKLVSYFLIAFICIEIVIACQLSGYESGECMLSAKVVQNITFCKDYLPTNICVPLQRSAWKEYDTQQRDQFIKAVFVKQIEQRLISEVNGNANVILLSNEPCYYAYKEFLCRWNFPSCNSTTNATQPLCMSQCTSYFGKCSSDSTSCELSYQDINPGLDPTC